MHSLQPKLCRGNESTRTSAVLSQPRTLSFLLLLIFELHETKLQRSYRKVLIADCCNGEHGSDLPRHIESPLKRGVKGSRAVVIVRWADGIRVKQTRASLSRGL